MGLTTRRVLGGLILLFGAVLAAGVPGSGPPFAARVMIFFSGMASVFYGAIVGARLAKLRHEAQPLAAFQPTVLNGLILVLFSTLVGLHYPAYGSFQTIWLLPFLCVLCLIASFLANLGR